jgi:DNA-binding NtrC family response regulator
MRQQPRLLFGTSGTIRKALDQCARFAPGRDPILLVGERGTGKTVLARHIHDLSGRGGEFVDVSASHIPANLELAHLGGHSRGAYTGADHAQIGLLEAAHRGTFFLDELGNASPIVQEILLQVLEQGTIRRVREIRPLTLDIRFIFATNASLPAMVERGAFRRDLCDRLGFCGIRVPSLRERRDEIPGLLELFLSREAMADGLETPPSLSDELVASLQAAPWNGNIRELENLCRYFVKYWNLGRPLGIGDLPCDFVAPLGDILRQRHEGATLARQARAALLKTGGDKSAAARLIGVSRRHFYRLLARHPETASPESVTSAPKSQMGA